MDYIISAFKNKTSHSLSIRLSGTLHNSINITAMKGGSKQRNSVIAHSHNNTLWMITSTQQLITEVTHFHIKQLCFFINLSLSMTLFPKTRGLLK